MDTLFHTNVIVLNDPKGALQRTLKRGWHCMDKGYCLWQRGHLLTVGQADRWILLYRRFQIRMHHEVVGQLCTHMKDIGFDKNMSLSGGLGYTHFLQTVLSSVKSRLTLPELHHYPQTLAGLIYLCQISTPSSCTCTNSQDDKKLC